ncbi:carbon starvation protein A [Dysgonomonas sp. 511]|uniref:carbon starvation CstA family protein n=1 Tax=Dysgonomonas sp. 511 TaxID=2302930 RepID=UPI0013D52AF4|nr:carbon starvation protein A [Dysgonomonas sp. 511]NDV79349.1 carbon starvation protein A [Dysgonomonas sp. 511]
MISFFIAVAVLIGGYFVYGSFVEKVFGADKNRQTPAFTHQDGVDYVPMGWGRIFLIQFLNIAGLGPIFGAIMGAIYGPAAFLWIVFGTILGGAVHDYMSGMLSLRNGGKSLPELAGIYMGVSFKQFMRLFTLFLMILVGAVFIAGPARLLTNMTPGYFDFTFWSIVIFVYYMLATLLPIDKLIGKIYPLFGFAILFMAVGVGGSIIYHWMPVPEVVPSNLVNMHPNPSQYPLFPMMFISIACGAISGFHATQSPMMARCLKNEKQGRRVFYGAMVAEGLVALIWAAAAMSFFGTVGGLQAFLAENGNNAAVVVDKITHTWLGKVGAILAILGVIAAPITSGDTAFRSARLIVSDFVNFDQKPLKNRLFVSIPLFVVGFILLQVNFDILWRYFAWANQMLATATLWTITVYLCREKKCFWITFLPAMFMTMVVSTYIVIAPEGLGLPLIYGNITGAVCTVLATGMFVYWKKKREKVLL